MVVSPVVRSMSRRRLGGRDEHLVGGGAGLLETLPVGRVVVPPPMTASWPVAASRVTAFSPTAVIAVGAPGRGG